MTFEWPSMLLTMFAVPLLAGIYVLSSRRYRRLVSKLDGFGLVQTSTGSRAGIRRHIPPFLFLVSLAVMNLALARPQALVTLPSVEGTVILVFDVSGSMLAEDIQPSRLEAAKTAAIGFVEHQPTTVRIGIVAFSDGGLLVLSPTNDQDVIIDSIKRLSPQRASAVGSGLETAIELVHASNRETADPQDPTKLPADPAGVIVLLSDGENNMNPDPLEAAKIAADTGVRIDTIGIGTSEGVTLEVNGFVIHTQLEEEGLQQIARVSGGNYYNGSAPEDLSRIYEGIRPRLLITEEKLEITSLFAALGMVLLLSGGVISLLWFGRAP